MSTHLTEAVLIINPTAAPFYFNEKFKNTNLITIACFTSTDIEHLIKPCVEAELFDDRPSGKESPDDRNLSRRAFEQIPV